MSCCRLVLTRLCMQEHHGQPLRHLVFNAMDADKGNLFATVAHNQVRAPLHSSKLHSPYKLFASCVAN